MASGLPPRVPTALLLLPGITEYAVGGTDSWLCATRTDARLAPRPREVGREGIYLLSSGERIEHSTSKILVPEAQIIFTV